MEYIINTGINKWGIYTVRCYSALKRMEALMYATAYWMNLQDISVGVIMIPQYDCCIITLIWAITVVSVIETKCRMVVTNWLEEGEKKSMSLFNRCRVSVLQE